MLAPGPHLHPVGTDRVEVCYGATRALREVSLAIPYGVTALLGHNGAGKSSLLRVLVGAQRPTSGEVRREGRDIAAGGTALADHRAATGWLPQRPGLPGTVTVEAFLDYVAWHVDLPRTSRAQHVRRVLDVTDCESLRSRRIRSLSGGQRQRAALAAALLGEPDLLLLDEPTTGLDPSQRELFYRTVRAASSDAAVVLSTHLIEDVLAVADHVLVVADQSVEGPIPLSTLVDRDDPAAAFSTVRALMGEPR